MKKCKVLIAGRLDLGPIGRHFLSFMNYLLKETDYDIYIDEFFIDMYRCEAFGTSKLEKELKMNNRVHTASKTLYYDFAVFTELLTLGYDKIYEEVLYEEFLSYKSCIKICYEVFDGSIPPRDWIDIINKNFDICLSPSVYISTSLKNNGIEIPCFNLPCVVFNDVLLTMEPPINEKKYRFGFIGGNEERKNLHKVIEAFYRCFKNNKDVELYIHSPYSAEPEYAKQSEELVQRYSKNVDIIYNYNVPLSDENMYKLLSSFSFYVYPSKTTGYFTTPAEALSVGIPIILTDIPVHQELVESLTEADGVYLIKADELDIMRHLYLGNKYLGVQYDCSVEEIAKQLIKAYSNREYLFSTDKIVKRKNIGKQYSLSGVAPLYSSVFCPEKFNISDSYGANKNNVIWGTKELLKKYLYIFPNLKVGSAVKSKGFMFYLHKEKETKLVEKLSRKLEDMCYRIMKLGDVSGIDFLPRAKVKTVFLFGMVPILKITQSEKKITFRLFSFVPLLKIQYKKRNKLVSIFGFIPIFKTKEKIK